MSDPSDVWSNQAAQWERVGSPLRPGAQDHAALEQFVSRWIHRNGAPDVLVLGVTPEMAGLGWPDGTNLLAVDQNQGMIDRVWPGFPRPGEGVLCANWLDLSLPDRSRDLIVSDGCFGVIRYPDQYRMLLLNVHRILRPNGVLAFRVFVRPEINELPSDVYRTAMDRRIGNFHAFKLRLLMAMQPDSHAGVRTGEVWIGWSKDGPTPEDLAARCDWPLEQVTTIDAYRDQDTVYTFPTLRELRSLSVEGGFDEIGCMWPSYELGERCPTLALVPQS